MIQREIGSKMTLFINRKCYLIFLRIFLTRLLIEDSKKNQNWLLEVCNFQNFWQYSKPCLFAKVIILASNEVRKPFADAILPRSGYEGFNGKLGLMKTTQFTIYGKVYQRITDKKACKILWTFVNIIPIGIQK